MTSRWVLIAFLALTGLVDARCLADGKMFPVIDHRANIPDQQALIVWRDGVETLAIETRFVGTGTDFAWVVPLPSVPDVSPATTGLFPTLRLITQPRLVDSSGAVGICWFLAWLLVLVTAIRFTRGWSGILIVTLIICSLATCLVPSLGTVRGVPAGPEVVIHERAIVGSYDTVTISGKDGAALSSWLGTNGFAIPAEAKAVVNDYAMRGWCFVAAKLRRAETSDKPSTPHPLVFKFATESPVYPMRLTGVGSTGLGLELYIIGPEAAAVSGMNVVRCTRPRYAAPESGTARRLRGRGHDEVVIGHVGLRELAGDGAVLTRLSGHLSPAQMRSDMEVVWTSFEEKQARVWSYGGAWAMGLCVFLAALSFGPVVGGVVRRARQVPGKSQKRVWRDWIIIAAAAGLMLFVLLPKVSVTSARSEWRAMLNASEIVLVLWRITDESAVAPSTMTLEELRAALRKELGDELPPEEDSPGRYVISRTDEGFMVRTFDADGQEFRELVPFADKAQ